MALGEPDASGRRRPEPLPGSEHDLEADTIVFAIGQQGDADAARRASRGSRTTGGRIAVDERQATGNARVFAAGDAVRGPDSVIWAMAEGQRAALAVHAARQRRGGRAARLDAHRLRPRDAAARRDRQGRAPEGAAHRGRAAPLRLRRGRGALPGEGRRSPRRRAACSAASAASAAPASRPAARRARSTTPARARTARAAAARRRCAPTPPSRSAPAPEHLLCDGAGTRRRRRCSSGCGTTRTRRCRRGAGALAGAPGVHVFLCTCNDSVHHRDLVEPLAAEVRALPGVVGATIVNAACQQEGGAGPRRRADRRGARARPARRLPLLPARDPLRQLHAPARAGQGFPLLRARGSRSQLVETVNLRDEVLNQRGLDRATALRLARRALRAGVARALAGARSRRRSPAPADTAAGDPAPPGDDASPAAARRPPRPAPAAGLRRHRGGHRRRALPRLRHLRQELPAGGDRAAPARLGHPARAGRAGSLHALRPLPRGLPRRRAGRAVCRPPPGPRGARRRLRRGAPVSAPRIVIFSCQWAPHYAFQSLYRRGRRGEGDGVRVLTACVGRVGEDLVLEAFRQGADGVAVLGCPPGALPPRARPRSDSTRASPRCAPSSRRSASPRTACWSARSTPTRASGSPQSLERFAAGIAHGAGRRRDEPRDRPAPPPRRLRGRAAPRPRRTGARPRPAPLLRLRQVHVGLPGEPRRRALLAASARAGGAARTRAPRCSPRSGTA